MTTPIPDAGYPSNIIRTVSDIQTYVETMLSINKEQPGGTGEAASVQLSSHMFMPGNNACFCPIDTEGMSPSDTLNQIQVDNVRDGMIIYLRITDNSRVITITNGAGGTGQILTQSGNNILLNDKRMFLALKYNAAISAFEELSSSGSGPLNKYNASAFPTNNDDLSEGYGIGSLWFYPGAQYLGICIDNAEFGAQWRAVGANALLGPDIFSNGVSINLLNVVPESTDTLSFPPAFAYISGQRISYNASDFSYGASSWTYDLADVYGNIEHVQQDYDTDPPTYDPRYQLLYQKVVTDDLGSGYITEITPLCSFVSPTLLGYAQPIPTTTGLLLQTVPSTTNLAGIDYGLLELTSIDPTGATGNQLIGFDGTNFNLFYGLAGVSVSTDTSITLTPDSASLQRPRCFRWSD